MEGQGIRGTDVVLKRRKELAEKLKLYFTDDEIAEIRRNFIMEFLTEKINADPIKKEWGIQGSGIARLHDVREWVREVLIKFKLYDINVWISDAEKEEKINDKI